MDRLASSVVGTSRSRGAFSFTFSSKLQRRPQPQGVVQRRMAKIKKATKGSSKVDARRSVDGLHASYRQLGHLPS